MSKHLARASVNKTYKQQLVDNYLTRMREEQLKKEKETNEQSR